MRKVFLDELPHNGKLIDWINSIGYEVKFVYDLFLKIFIQYYLIKIELLYCITK